MIESLIRFAWNNSYYIPGGRRLLCAILGHGELLPYCETASKWMKPGHSWCTYCARFIRD